MKEGLDNFLTGCLKGHKFHFLIELWSTTEMNIYRASFGLGHGYKSMYPLLLFICYCFHCIFDSKPNDTRRGN